LSNSSSERVFYLYFTEYSPHQKIIPTEDPDISQTSILCPAQIFNMI